MCLVDIIGRIEDYKFHAKKPAFYSILNYRQLLSVFIF